MGIGDPPSDPLFTSENLRFIRELYLAGTIIWTDRPYHLKSGVDSRVYVGVRHEVTERPRLLMKIGKRIADAVNSIHPTTDELQPCLIGIPTAGTPLAVAASLHSGKYGCRQMRQVQKVGHGMSHGWTDAAPDPKHWYVTIENVMTTGLSIWEALERLREDGHSIERMHHIVFIDREQGGVEFLASQGIRNVTSVYTLRDIVRALHHMGLWGEDRLSAVEKEIQASRAA